VIRWLLLIFLALLIFQGLYRWLERLGLGRLPGDFRFQLFGKPFFIPVASSVLLSLVAMVISKVI
jgi:hypothetical protein